MIAKYLNVKNKTLIFMRRILLDSALDRARRRRVQTFRHPARQVCEAAGKKGSQVRAYPSGHGTLAYAQGIILARLMPNKGQIILARAEDFAESRMICGVHSRSDIRASAVLGSTIGTLLLHNAEFKPLLDSARAELSAAGLNR